MYLPHKIYRVLEKNSSLLCIDLFIVDSVKQPKKLLAIKRAQEPGKGLWFQPGGRIYKNESISQAAIRKAKEELGVEIALVRPLGFYRSIFSKDHSGKGSLDSSAIVLLATLKSKEIVLDKTSTDFAWKNFEDPTLSQITFSLLCKFKLLLKNPSLNLTSLLKKEGLQSIVIFPFEIH